MLAKAAVSLRENAVRQYGSLLLQQIAVHDGCLLLQVMKGWLRSGKLQDALWP